LFDLVLSSLSAAIADSFSAKKTPAQLVSHYALRSPVLPPIFGTNSDYQGQFCTDDGLSHASGFGHLVSVNLICCGYGGILAI
jgi:hypothetical protein